MAFVLKQDDRFTWPISFDVPVDGGRHQRQTFDGEFVRLSQSRLRELGEAIQTEEASDQDIAREVLERLLDIPMLATAIVTTYFKSLQGAKAKN